MAAVSAMYRPGGALDPSCYATQRIYDTPESTRSKKWSSKLKLNTSGSIKSSSEKSPESPYMYGTISGPGGSALSKQMKYAETWLYGSVRTQTPSMRPSVFQAYPEVSGPVLISTPQKPTPHNYAVILCSCPEYLNGTKKTSSTKVSICKKCKGSRLPLTIAESPRLLVGGTVRGPQVNRDGIGNGLLRAGTVRVQGNKSRPSILKPNGETDPYDLMRRSRLAPPHEARIGSQFSTTRSRAKSISPCRVRTKRPSPETLRKNRSKSVSRVNDVWVDEEVNMNESKKSILHCDINPYDLVKSSGSSKSLLEIEFDDSFGDVFQESLKNNNLRSLSKSRLDSNVKAISGQRIRVAEESKSNLDQVLTYDSVNYDLKNTESQGISPSLCLPNIKNESKKSTPINKNINKKILSIPTSNRTKQKSVSPKRPPRRVRNIKTDDDSESDNQRLPDRNFSRKLNETLRYPKYKNQNADTIKSILKKPRNYELHDSNTKTEISEDSFESKRVNSSQFYIPKPKDKGRFNCSQNMLQRKRVQFLVEKEETRVICTAEINFEQTTVREVREEANTNDEDIVAQGDVVSQSLQNEKSSTETNQTNDNFETKNADISELINQELRNEQGAYEDVQINSNRFASVVEENAEATTNNGAVGITNDYPANLEDNNIPKIPILRRSESERLTTVLTISPPKFLDTMALRPKTKHGHTSQIFLISGNDSEMYNNNQSSSFSQASKSGIIRTATYNQEYESGNLSDSSDITKQVLNHLRRGLSESPEPPPRQKSKDRLRSKKHNYVKTRFIRNNSTSSTSDEWSDANDYEQKTVLRVKQFDSDETDEPKEASSAMRFMDNEPRKTSIQINGNECYSTMNVSSDTPIYLSSVLVNEDYGNTCNTYQTGTTVTISVGTPEKEIKKSKSQIYIGAVLSDEKEHKMDANTYEEYCTDNNRNVSGDSNESNKLSSILSDPVEAVRRNLIPHVCGKKNEQTSGIQNMKTLGNYSSNDNQPENGDFVTKLFDDPFFGHLAEGLDSDLVKKLIENSLIKLQESKNQEGTENNTMTIEKLIESSLKNLKEEVSKKENAKEEKPKTQDNAKDGESEKEESVDTSVCQENDDNGCSAPYESMEYESGAMGIFSDLEPMSDCYNASASELSTEDDTNSTRSKFYQMLVDAALCEIDTANNTDDDHHYESIRLNSDPIYEEIGDMPPPLPTNPPPNSMSLMDDEKRSGSRSIFEGASKYDILSYLVDAKERGIDDEETYITSYVSENGTTLLENPKQKNIRNENINTRLSSHTSQLSHASDSSEDNSLTINNDSLEKTLVCKKTSAEIERNDSGVGSETSKSSRSRLQGKTSPCTISDNPIHLCEDCDTTVETQVTGQGSIYSPLVCRKCAKKRAERKDIITEIVETEEKYGRDLQIILEEFYKPMLVAGLLTQEQLSAIFLNVEELIENNQVLSEKLRDTLEIATDQGDEDLLTVNVGKILLECSGMLAAFQSYCVKQAGAALLLAGLEKEKELLRIFLRVSQMENAVLRRMNLNSFLMVPVQRVTKYPLLLSRLHRATAACATEREDVKAAQRCVECRLEEINSAAAAAAAAARDVPLWRRLAAARRTAHDLHVADIRLRKMAVDVLDWNHDDARFAMEGKLLFTQPNDNNWRKGRTIKLTSINALLVTNGKPTTTHKTNEIRETREARDREAREREGEALFARSGVREAALLLVREKAGRYTLQREPLFLDRCVVAADHEPEHFFEVHEITTKDSYIFKAEESPRTRTWYRQLQYHAQGAGAWRKRRNALANIMINPMLTRN